MNKVQVCLYLLLITVLAKETIVCFQLSPLPPPRTTIRLSLSTKTSKPLTRTQAQSQFKITKGIHDYLTVTETNHYNNDEEAKQINQYTNKDTNAMMTFIISTVAFLTTFPSSSTATMMESLPEITNDSTTSLSTTEIATAIIINTSTTLLSDTSIENLISLAKEGGKWFFVIYVVVSLIAGAFEMSKRLITWVESNSTKKEMNE